MASEPIRDPNKDHLLTPKNCTFLIIDYQPVQVNSIASMERQHLVSNIVRASKAAVLYGLPIVHSTVNVKSGVNKPPIKAVRTVLEHVSTYDRTSINAWEDVEFRKAVEATGRKNVVADAVGGTSITAHEMALRRVEQAGAKMISVTQLFCELQRDWSRKETVPGFMTLFFDMHGSAGVAAAED